MSPDRRPSFPAPQIKEVLRNVGKSTGRLVAATAAIASGAFGGGELGNPAFDAAQQFANGGKPPAGEGFKPFEPRTAEAADKPVDKSPIPVEKDAQGREVERLVVASAELPSDVPMRANGVEVGHFYTQTKGDAEGYVGYEIVNDAQAPMWRIFNQLGGVQTVGYPASNRYIDNIGRPTQIGQKMGLQINNGRVEFLNIYDELNNRGLNLDNPNDMVPKYMDWASDAGRDWSGGPNSIQQNHLDKVFSQVPDKMRQLYLANPDWFNQYGLPMGWKDYVNEGVTVVVCQRTTIQLWKNPTPWTNNQPNGVVFSNGGDVAKKYGLIPKEATTPILNRLGTGGEVSAPPAPQPPTPEAPSAAFPREIGNLQRDGVVIHNRGTRIGVVDNTDPQNNWAAIVAVARQYAPNDRFEFFFYDNPNDVPQPETLQTPYKYDPVAYWNNEFPGVGNGRGIAGKAPNGVWENHFSLPYVKPEDLNRLNRSINLIITYFYSKNNLFASQPPGFAAIGRRLVLDPYNSGRMNFPLKVVYK